MYIRMALTHSLCFIYHLYPYRNILNGLNTLESLCTVCIYVTHKSLLSEAPVTVTVHVTVHVTVCCHTALLIQ